MPLVRMQIGVPVESYVKLVGLSGKVTELAARRVSELSSKKQGKPDKMLTYLASGKSSISAVVSQLIELGLAQVGDSSKGLETLYKHVVDAQVRPGRKAYERVDPGAKQRAEAYAKQLKEAKP